MEELEQLASGEEVFENMVVTMKKLSEDEKIRMQCEAREDYERSLLTEYNAGKSEGIEQGIEQGIRSLVEICQMYEISYEKTKMSLRDKFELSEEKAEEFMEKFWR